jgi:hypothetical protein
MRSSTWRVGVAALWIASVEDTASIYDFHTMHGKISLCKIGFVCVLDYFAYLIRSFTSLLEQLRITTRRWVEIRLL